MEVHNVPEASDTNTFAEIGKSETFTDYHGISLLGGRKKGSKFESRNTRLKLNLNENILLR